MSHFARVIDGIVTEVIVAEQDVIDSGLFGDPSQWIQTSYNTYGGQHKFGGTPLRKNYAGPGYTYDPIKDAFIAPQPFGSWLLNQESCVWEPPVAHPNDGQHWIWEEAIVNWRLVE